MTQVAASATRPVDTEASARFLTFAGLGLCIVAFWMLQHPYEGLVHDSVLYSFLALARLHPGSLGHDLFLSQGSQDHYTLFGPIAAIAVRWLGLERAAASFTLIAHLAFLGAGWLLARRLMPAALAVLALGLLVMLPSVYGANHIFSYLEGFMTPRVPAEALVLGAIAAALAQRYLICGICMLAALVLHPLMAAAGIVLLFVLLFGLARPWLTLLLASASLVVLIAVSSWVPFGPIARFDPEWFELLHSRLSYLFPSLWPAPDWGHASVPLALLAVGAISSSQPHIRSVCWAALITGLSALGLTLLGSDLLHIEIVTQVQPWRWLWLSNTLAILLIPVIVGDCWRAAEPFRTVVVLLAAAVICIDEKFVPAIALLAVVAAVAAPRITEPKQARLLLLGAYALTALGLLVLLGSISAVLKKLPSIPPDTTLYNSDYLLQLRQLRPWASGGILPACILFSAWWISRRPRLTHAIAVLVLGSALCGAFFPLAWNAWTRVEFPARAFAQLAPWRQQIPPSAEVLWPDAAFGTWYLLERSSYWSTTQMGGVAFSRATAMELVQREWRLTHQPTHANPVDDLIQTCTENPTLGFVVTARDLGPTPFAPVIIDADRPDGHLHLYACDAHRG
jgi:hypothetical protein